MPAVASGSTSPSEPTAWVDVDIGDFAYGVVVTDGVDQVGWVGDEPFPVPAGEPVNLGGPDEGYAFVAYGNSGVLTTGWSADAEELPWNYTFVPEANQTYEFSVDFEAFLRPSGDSYLIGKLPFEPGAPNTEYYLDLDDYSGLIHYDTRTSTGALMDGEPFVVDASFEDRGIDTEIELSIDELHLTFDSAGALVDSTVDGTYTSIWGPLGSKKVQPVSHLEASYADERLELSFFTGEGGALLGEFELTRHPAPWNPPDDGGLVPDEPIEGERPLSLAWRPVAS